MATIANLSIGLSADSAELKKDLDKAKNHSKKWASGQKKEFASVAASVRLIGVAIAGVSFGAFIRGAVQTSKELKIMSNLTGESAAELQRVAPSLNRAGISLEKYSDILKDVNDKSNDFLQTGGGPMADFFEQVAPKIGITADAFKGLSGSDALGLYVSSLEKANLSQEQMTFYMEAIASDSTMLLPLLRNNAAGMNEFALATNQVLTGRTIDALTNIGTNFSTLGTIISNMTLNAMAPLLRFIEDMLMGWRELITDFPAIIYGFGAVAAAVAALTLVMMANPITLWITAIAAIIAGLGYAYQKFNEVADAVGGVGEVMTLLADSAGFEFRRISAYGTKLKLSLLLIFNGIQDAWQSTIINMSVSLGRWLDSIANSGAGKLFNMGGGNEQSAAASGWERMNAITDDFIKLTGAMNENNALLEQTNPHWAKLSDALAGDEPIQVEFDPSLRGPDLTNGGSGGAGGGTNPLETPEAKDFYETTAESFVDGLKSSFSTALASGDLKGFLSSALDSFTMGIISSFTEGLFKPVQDAMSGFMGNLFSGMGGGGSGFFSGIGSIFGFAEGGFVPNTSTSKSYADSVPAMLQPGELVVPKSQVDGFLNGGGSGGGQTFNINVSGDVSRQTRSEIVKMLPEIAGGVNMVNRENNRR
jgi:hypothetical protein